MSNTVQQNILRRYYNMVFPAELKENEYVRLLMIKPPSEENPNPIPFQRFAKNFDEYTKIVQKYKYNCHVYNSLCTVKMVDGEIGGESKFQRQRRVLYLDFDLKDFPELSNPDAFTFTQMIKSKFPNLFLHAYYATGGGFHYYISVKPTCNWRELVELNGELVKIIGTDPNANKPTQIARVPTTYNLKYKDSNGKNQYVKEIDNKFNVRPINGSKGFYETSYIKTLINRAKRGISENPQEQPLKEWDYTENDGMFEIKQYPCLCNQIALEQGVDEHERNIFMGRLIWGMLKKGYADSKIHSEIQKWNLKCRPPKNEQEVSREVEGYLKNKDTYKLGGCYENIPDPRVRAVIEKYCDKSHCYDAHHDNKIIHMKPEIGAKVNKKILTRNQLSSKGKTSMNGYEYLILTVLDKHIPANSRKLFTIGTLKKRLMYKKNGKWQLCMDISILKRTLEELVEHKCITLTDPTENQCKKKRPSFDDKIIRLNRRLKDVQNSGFIEFYYSSALAFICKQITQTEYKVFLCLIQQMESHKPCTLSELSYILDMDEANISRALRNLDQAQCIEISDQVGWNDKGQPYNIYKKKSTNIYDKETCSNETDMNEIIDDNGAIKNMPDSITIKLLA